MSSPSQLVLFPQPLYFLISVLCACSYLFEDFDCRLLYFLSSIPSVCLPSFCLSCAHAFCTLCLFSFHHEDHAHALFCLLMSTYSSASSSSLRNFLTLKFLSEEFIKIVYSPPSSRLTALPSMRTAHRPSFAVAATGDSIPSAVYMVSERAGL